MALIKCIECGREISDKAVVCPQCGCPSTFQSQQPTTESTLKANLDPRWDDVLDELDSGSSLGAMIIIREITNVSIKEASDIVDYMEIHREPPAYILNIEEPEKTVIACSACNNQISIKAEVCPHCGNPTGVHVCPKCGSTNTKTISGTSKAASVLLWGPFAANKVVSKYQCKACWHKF